MRRSLVMTALLAVGVAACGGSPSPSPSASSAPSVAPSAAPSASPSAAPSAAPSPAASPSTAGTIYVVKKGDTLYAIAVKNKTTVKAILAANPDITDPNFLKIGQKIVIPAP